MKRTEQFPYFRKSKMASELDCFPDHNDPIYIQAKKIATLVKAANILVESYWPSLFAKHVEKKNIEDLILNDGSGGGGGAVAVSASVVGAAPAAAAPAVEEKKEEPKEESDDDIFSLFD